MTKFHSGKIRVDTANMLEDSSVILHSDTLFSALINLANKVMPEQIEDVINWFSSDKLHISSIFYCLEKNEKYIYFLPKPIHFDTEQGGADRKSIKKIDFISKGIWEQKTAALDWFDENKCTVFDNEFVCLNSELYAIGIAEKLRKSIRMYDIITTPKVHVHKSIEDKNDRYYTQTNIHIADNEGIANVHLYFLLNDSLGKEVQGKLNTLLTLLPHEGIGGDRSAGSGIFEEKIESEFDFKNHELADKNIALSLSIPANDEEFKAFDMFKFTTRGGRQTANDGTLKRIRMIKEGAVLTDTVKGVIVDISNDTKDKNKAQYLRCGKCLTLKY
jgi:CRISPR-associated protein Csm4